MKKFLLTSLLICVTSTANAFILSNCPIEGKSIQGTVNGSTFYTSELECNEYGICNTTVFTSAGAGLYQIKDIQIVCNDTTGILVNGNVRCFWQNNSLYCPAIDETETQSFAYQGRIWVYPQEVPIFRFQVQ